MLYVIGREDGRGKILLVKAEDDNDLKQRINLKEDEVKLACFTTSELQALSSSVFVVISS